MQVNQGKFLITKKSSTRMVDFESLVVRKSIKVSILPENNIQSNAPVVPYTAQVPFDRMFQYASSISTLKPAPNLHQFRSVCIKRDKQAR